MASSTVTRVGGVVVVTQVIPQNEQNAVALEDTPPRALTTPPACQAPPPAPVKTDKMAAEFLRGEPVILGIFQLVFGLVLVLFSFTAAFHRILLLHLPLCSSGLLVVAGCVTLKASKSTSLFLVRLTAGWSVLGSLLSAGGAAYLGWLMSLPRPSRQLCDELDYENCFKQGLWSLDSLVLAMRILFLVLFVMELAFSLVVSIFAIKAARQRHLQNVLSDAGSDESLLKPE